MGVFSRPLFAAAAGQGHWQPLNPPFLLTLRLTSSHCVGTPDSFEMHIPLPRGAKTQPPPPPNATLQADSTLQWGFLWLPLDACPRCNSQLCVLTFSLSLFLIRPVQVLSVRSFDFVHLHAIPIRNFWPL